MASAAEQQYIADGINQNIRLDGRACLDHRPIEVQLGLIAQAGGSARLQLGATDVIVGVKLELTNPDPEAPDRGKLQVSVEFSSVASPEYQGRGGDSWSAELAHALQTSLTPGASTSGSGVDLTALSLVSGKRCWMLYIDALVLNDGGNILGALSLAAVAALSNTRIPRVEMVEDEEDGGIEIELDDDMSTAMALDFSQLPIIVTISQVGSQAVVDMEPQEENCAAASIHVAVNAQGEMCGMSQEGRRGVQPSMLQVMLEAAQRTGPAVLKQLHTFLKQHGREGATAMHS